MTYLRLAGLFTWMMTGLPQLLSNEPDRFGAWLPPWLAFGVLFWIGSSERMHRSRTLLITMLVAQSVTATIALWYEPSAFLAVLYVVVAGGAAAVVSAPIATAWAIANTIVMILVFARTWQMRNVLPVAGAYLAFQVFAMITAQLADRESRARRELAIANAELRAAADLLAAGSRMNERIRISRDLHDLLGHHLTALSVNLEVAAHLTDGKAREHVEHAQSLAKLLLSDVRAVVSDLRDEEPIDVATMLARIVEPVPRPRVELTVDPSLRVSDPSLAQTLLRSVQEIVTNAMRHANALTLRINVDSDDQQIVVRASDDGRGAPSLQLGSGLRGMRERAEALGGRVDIRSERGFHVVVTLPRREIAA